MHYMIISEGGQELSSGIQTADRARELAQAMADNMGAPVSWCEAREGAADHWVEPTAQPCPPPALPWG